MNPRRILSAPVGLVALMLATACSAKPDLPGKAQSGRRSDPPPRLRYETVRSILEDSSGRFWFGSWNEGVCRDDGTSLTYFTTKDGLSSSQIRSIHEDRDGVVWFEGGTGTSGFDGQKIVTPSSKDHAAKDAWKAEPGDLWFKEDGSVGATASEPGPGVYRYDGKTFHFLAYPPPAVPARATEFATTGFARGKNGRLWFATYAAVFGFDGKTFTVLDDTSLGLGANTGRLHVRCVLEDRKGNLWIGNNGIGVIRHDGRVATNFTQEHGLGKTGMHGDRATPLPGDVTDGSPTLHRVFALGEDRDGNIWFGTIDHGAWRYDGKGLRNFTARDGLTSKDVFCIYTDRRGELWVAGNGVFKFDGTRFERVH